VDILTINLSVWNYYLPSNHRLSCVSIITFHVTVKRVPLRKTTSTTSWCVKATPGRRFQLPVFVNNFSHHHHLHHRSLKLILKTSIDVSSVVIAHSFTSFLCHCTTPIRPQRQTPLHNQFAASYLPCVTSRPGHIGRCAQ